MSPSPRRWALLTALVVSTFLAPAATTVHVAPSGDDQNDGSAGKPLRSPQAAVLRAREQARPGAPVVVEFEPGRYPLESPLRISAADSGLTLRARVPGKTEIVGSRRVEGWRRSAARPDLWEATLPESAGAKWRFRELYLDGRRAPVARAPKTGFFRTAGRLAKTSPIEAPYHEADIRPSWTAPSGVRLVMLMKWTDLHLPILSVDETKHVLRLPGGPPDAWMDEPDGRYWIENAPEALTEAGEWRLDEASGVVSLLGAPGFDPAKARVTAPVLEQLVLVDGDSAGKAVADLRFEGLRFAEADYPFPPNGLISPQAAVPVHGVLVAHHAVHGVVSDCTFANLGGYAIELGRGCQGWKIEGNRIEDMGAGGVRLGEPGDRSPSEYDACHTHSVTDNEMVRLGRVFAPAVGVIIFQSGANHVAHNHIHDLYYTGISVGWTWGYQASPCRANVIEYNVVEDVGQGRLSDMGGIYTLGPQPGTVIRGNIFRNVTSYDYGGWGLYTDEGSTGILLENNLSIGNKSAGFHQHYGENNVLRWNILIGNGEHALMRTRDEDHRSFWFTNNVVVFDSGNLLGSNWGGDTNRYTLDGNLYWNPRLGEAVSSYVFNGQPLPAWQAAGRDVHSRVADPLFLDPQHPERGFRRDSPVWAMGFRWTDLSKAGVRPKRERTP